MTYRRLESPGLAPTHSHCRRGASRAAVVIAAGLLSGVLFGAAVAQTPVPPPPPAGAPASAGLERYVRLLRNTGLSDGRSASWQVWWALNKDFYTGLVRRGELRREYATAREVEPPLPRGVRVRLIRPDLELALRDKQTIVRVSAAYALGLLGDPKAEPALTRALADSGSEVQDAAILALGMLGVRGPVTADGAATGVQTLIELVKDTKSGARRMKSGHVNDQRRATAAIALGMTRSNASGPVLGRIAFGRRSSRELRAGAIAGLGLLGGADAEQALIRLYREKKTGIQLRSLCVSALGRTGGDGARKALLGAIRHKKTEIRRSAALALGHLALRSPKSEELASAIDKRRALAPGSAVVARLDAVIAELEPQAERERLLLDKFVAARRAALRSAAAGDSEYAVRQFACIALGQVGWSQDRAFLFYRLGEDLLDTRPFAALALGILGGRGGDEDGAAKKVLLDALRRERRQDHRIAFALALGLRGATEAGPVVLRELEETSDPLSRAYYAMALGLIGHEQGLPAVVETLLDVRERDAVELASMAYGLLADSPTTDKLLRKIARGRDHGKLRGVAAGVALYGRSGDLRVLSRYVRSGRAPAASRSFALEALGIAGDTRDPSPLAALAAAHNYLVAFSGIDRALLRKW